MHETVTLGSNFEVRSETARLILLPKGQALRGFPTYKVGNDI